MKDRDWRRWQLACEMDSRAKGFHRAVERIGAVREGRYFGTVPDLKQTVLRARRRWAEFRRAAARYAAVGGDLGGSTFTLYHLANAYRLWTQLRLPRLMKRAVLGVRHD